MTNIFERYLRRREIDDEGNIEGNVGLGPYDYAETGVSILIGGGAGGGTCTEFFFDEDGSLYAHTASVLTDD